MATLRVTRPGGGFRDALRAYRIIIDDQDAGKIRRGQTIDIPTTPGSHCISLRSPAAGRALSVLIFPIVDFFDRDG